MHIGVSYSYFQDPLSKRFIRRFAVLEDNELILFALIGTVAGVYVGMEYGVERIRGTRDWVFFCLCSFANFLLILPSLSSTKLSFFVWILQKNAMLGGALTGAIVSAASNHNKDKVLIDAITGGAVATAAEFLNYLT